MDAARSGNARTIIRGVHKTKKPCLWCLSFLLCVSVSACTAQPSKTLTSSGNENPVTAERPAPSQAADPATAIPEILRSVLGDSEESPTRQQQEEMERRIAALGFPVLRIDENMQNYEPVAKFSTNAAAGKDGKVTVFFTPWSHAISVTFVSQSGKMTCAYAQYDNETATIEEP
jgi:hypothetical protein